MKQKAFFIIFEGLSLKQIKKKIFVEGESPTLSHLKLLLEVGLNCANPLKCYELYFALYLIALYGSGPFFLFFKNL